jgi:hypothetical protein
LVVGRGVTPDYFRALNIPIIQGRNFAEEDRSSSEFRVILSRSFAERIFPGENSVGQRIERNPDRLAFNVVGVAENVKNSGLTEENVPEIYFLRRNVPQDWYDRAPGMGAMSGKPPTLIVDTVLPSKAIAPWVRQQIAALDPTVPVKMETLNETVNKLAERPRFETALLGFFAFCGLLMAVIGLYGVIAFMATQRTQEIGVRMALGATRLDILRLISGEGVRLIALGGVVGLVAALATEQLLKSLLYNVSTHDPLEYAAAALLLGVVALAATLIPARAAMRVEPVVALRNE